MIRVGVLRGGNLNGHGKSVAIGGRILDILNSSDLKDKYKAYDIYLDKNMNFHLNGVLISLEKLHHNIDVVFNALFANEDGKIQQLLHSWNLPHTSSDIFPTARLNNKFLYKEHVLRSGFNTPSHIVVKKCEIADQDSWANVNSKQIWKLMPPPWVVTSVDNNIDLKIICNTYPNLVEVLHTSLARDNDLLIEERITGKELVFHTLENLRNQSQYKFPLIEKKNNDEYVYPSSLNQEERNKLEKNIENIHNEFGLDHYSQIHLTLSPGGKIYINKINTIPDMSSNSAFTKALDVVGVNENHAIDTLIINALRIK